MDNNTDIERYEASEFSLEQFDNMPKIIRVVYAHAPYNVHPNDYFYSRMVANKHNLKLLKEDVKAIIADFKITIHEEALRLYGPMHPQAKGGADE